MRWQDIRDDREKYQSYLASREWGILKEAIRERSGGTCERCCLYPMDHVHHLTYARKYAELLEDLQALCLPCHNFTHAKSNFDPLVDPLKRKTDPFDLLNPIDRELIKCIFGDPGLIGLVVQEVPPAVMRDPELKAILLVCRDFHAANEPISIQAVSRCLEGPKTETLIRRLIAPIDLGPLPPDCHPAAYDVCLEGVIVRLKERMRQDRLRDLKAALHEISEDGDPLEYGALQTEYHRVLDQHPATRRPK